VIGGSSAAAELAALSPWPDPAPPISPGERAARIERARALMTEAGADALLIGAGASLLYFAGISWGASERLVAMLLPRRGMPILISPAFEQGSLEAELAIEADLRLWEEDESPAKLVAAALRETGAGLERAAAVDDRGSVGQIGRRRGAADALGLEEG
jgi:Xaa-Pro dipeptidase